MSAGYELIYAYAPRILQDVKNRAEQHEKDIYHELRELNGLSKTKIMKNNTSWKQELREMLSLEGYQLTYEDLTPEVYQSITDTLASSGYTTEIAEDLGIQSLIETLNKGHFKNNPSKKLSPAQLNGLKKELIVTIKRFMWAKDLDPRAVVFNTAEFNRGAYSEGKLDIGIKLPSVGNRRQVRSEVKSNTEIFKIGTLGDTYLKPIFDNIVFSVNPETHSIKITLSAKKIREQCDAFLMDQHKEFFPFIEDGNSILLFSDFIENLIGKEPTKQIELRNYGEPIWVKDILDQDLKEKIIKNSPKSLDVEDKNKIAKRLGLSSNKYSLWYAKR